MKHMNKFIRLLSAFLMIVVVFTLFPAAAAGNDVVGTDGAEPTAETGFGSEPTLDHVTGNRGISFRSGDIILPALPLDDLNVEITPSLTNEADAGDTALFIVNVTGGTAPYTFEWQYRTTANGTWRSTTAYVENFGSRSEKLVEVIAGRHGYQYRCVVTDSEGLTETTEGVTLRVNLAVSISPAPVMEAEAESSGKFTAVVLGGTAPYTFEWQYRTTANGAWRSTASNVDIFESRSEKLVEVITARNGFQYRCVITDSKGRTGTTEGVTLEVHPKANLTVAISPAPVLAAEAGTSEKFTAVVSSGTAPYTFEWQYRTTANGAWRSTAANVENFRSRSEKLVEVIAARHGFEYRCVITDSKGRTGTTEEVTLKVNLPVTISPAPVMEATAGSSEKFTAAVSSGTAPYTFEWQYRTTANGAWRSTAANVENFRSRSEKLVEVIAARHGFEYRCVITDSEGRTGTSDGVTLQVHLKVTTTPSQTVEVGEGLPAVIKATVSGGSQNYTYQWKYRTSSSGTWYTSTDTTAETATTSTLTTSAVTATRNGYQFKCVVTDNTTGLTGESAPVTLRVIPVGVTVTPSPTNPVDEGGTAVFTAHATGGTGSYTYQWKYQAPNAAADTWANCTSAHGTTGYTSATLRVPAELTWKGYKYKCVVTDTNTKKTATSEATELVVLTVRVLTQPVGTTKNPGDAVTLTVEIEKGTAPYTYQWYWAPACDMNDTHQAGTTVTNSQKTNAYTFEVPANSCESRWYHCVITDSKGNTAVTEQVLVQYHIVASIERTPSGDTVSHGTTVTMTAKVQGGAKLQAQSGADRYTYVWYFIKQGTSAKTAVGTGGTYTFTMDGSKLGTYFFEVTDALGDTKESSRDAILHN